MNYVLTITHDDGRIDRFSFASGDEALDYGSRIADAYPNALCEIARASS